MAGFIGERMYRAIMADPPWNYHNYSEAKHGAASHHYSTMSTEEVCALDVQSVADKDCALFLWVTQIAIAEGRHLKVCEAWGFKPVTIAFVWNKTTSKGDPYCGLGFWTRSGSEFVLLGRRGNVKRRPEATGVRQVITAPRDGRHSAKPREIYDRIEALVEGPYLELFARDTRMGWDAWGNEVKSSVCLGGSTGSTTT